MGGEQVKALGSVTEVTLSFSFNIYFINLVSVTLREHYAYNR